MVESTTKSSTEQLPPGTVLGPDGKPCKVCSGADWRTWSNPGKRPPAAKSTYQTNANTPKGVAALGGSAVAASIASDSITSAHHDHDQSECPVNVQQLGRATWTFLHTAAAYYPEQPSATQKSSMLSLLNSLPVTYPCSHCASHLGENLKEHPPDVSGRGALSQWLCQRHNDVNVRLGKPSFDCAKTDERWLTGPPDGRCD